MYIIRTISTYYVNTIYPWQLHTLTSFITHLQIIMVLFLILSYIHFLYFIMNQDPHMSCLKNAYSNQSYYRLRDILVEGKLVSQLASSKSASELVRQSLRERLTYHVFWNVLFITTLTCSTFSSVLKHLKRVERMKHFKHLKYLNFLNVFKWFSSVELVQNENYYFLAQSYLFFGLISSWGLTIPVLFPHSFLSQLQIEPRISKTYFLRKHSLSLGGWSLFCCCCVFCRSPGSLKW